MKSEKIISLNPGKNYEKIGEVDISSNHEIDEKVKKAKQAHNNWQKDIITRISKLEELYNAFVKRQYEISSIASEEMGMPISVNKEIDIMSGLRYMRGYLDFAVQWLEPEIIFENGTEIHYLFFESKGVAAVSVPWNFPFCNFIWGVIQNLIVGNTVVFKHSEECPLTGKLLEEIIDSVNMPIGVFNEVYGDGSSVGEYLMNSDINLINFTGSTGVGKHLYHIAAKKFIPSILELGGSAAGIVFEDADLDIAIESIYFNRFINSGQSCDALKRLIVHQSLFDEVIKRLKKLIETKKIGNPLDSTTDLGPLVSQKQLITLENQVNDAIKKGAHIICGGKRPSNLLGAYYEPTILMDIKPDMSVWKEEVFGPVLPIVSFNTVAEAINLANDTQYGLGDYIYTKNNDLALQVSKILQTGNISINSANYVIPQDPFGGYKNSGLGRQHGKLGLRELCNTKVIALKK